MLPWLSDQVHSWEEAACAGAPTSPPMVPDTSFRIFAHDTSGAAFYAQAVLTAADSQVGLPCARIIRV